MKAASRERASRDSPAPLFLLRVLHLPFQHQRALDSSSNPAMVRQQEVQGPDPARGLTGTIWDSSLQNRDNKTTVFLFPGNVFIVMHVM